VSESKKRIEDAVWDYVAAHRPLKLLAILISALGILSGAITALEKPFEVVKFGTLYLLGVTPPASSVVIERNAFISGVFLHEARINAGDEEVKRKVFDAMEGAFKAVGFGGTNLKALESSSSLETRKSLAALEETFSGFLEAKSDSGRAFFRVGLSLADLMYATRLFRDAQHVQRAERDFRLALSQAQDTLRYRIPELPLKPAKMFESDAVGFESSLDPTEDALSNFLSVGGRLDLSRRDDRLKP
jgi:hypothetical protein